MPWRSLFVGMVLLLLSACSTFDTGHFAACPTAMIDSSGRPYVTIFFATNRGRVGDPMGFPTFGFERSDKLTYGRIVVSLPPDKDRQFGSITPDFRVLSASLANDEDDFATALRSEVVQRSSTARLRHGLVFVHGYNESFDRVVFRTAQMVHDGCLDVVPIMFSWPSRDSPLDYDFDLDSASFSRPNLAHLLRLVRDHSGFERSHIMAHSMGNWIVLEALKLLEPVRQSLGGTRSSRRFGTAILASPDVDLDIFRQDLNSAMASADSVVLLTSQNDFLLGLSKFLAHDAPRAGGSTNDELAEHHVVSKNNFAIIRMDGPEIGECVDGSHRCAETNATVLREIRQLLLLRGAPLRQSDIDQHIHHSETIY